MPSHCATEIYHVPTALSLATPYGLKGLALDSAMAERSELIVHYDGMRVNVKRDGHSRLP